MSQENIACKNEWYEADDGTIHIKLSRGKETVISKNSFVRVCGYRWYAARKKRLFYACSALPRGTPGARELYMHRLLTGVAKGAKVDHWDGDGLNNQDDNMRTATSRQNAQNRHDIRTCDRPGVSWHSRDRKWQSQLSVDGRVISLGNFDSVADAGDVYDKACSDVESGNFVYPKRARRRPRKVTS